MPCACGCSECNCKDRCYCLDVCLCNGCQVIRENSCRLCGLPSNERSLYTNLESCTCFLGSSQVCYYEPYNPDMSSSQRMAAINKVSPCTAEQSVDVEKHSENMYLTLQEGIKAYSSHSSSSSTHSSSSSSQESYNLAPVPLSVSPITPAGSPDFRKEDSPKETEAHSTSSRSHASPFGFQALNISTKNITSLQPHSSGTRGYSIPKAALPIKVKKLPAFTRAKASSSSADVKCQLNPYQIYSKQTSTPSHPQLHKNIMFNNPSSSSEVAGSLKRHDRASSGHLGVAHSSSFSVSHPSNESRKNTGECDTTTRNTQEAKRDQCKANVEGSVRSKQSSGFPPSIFKSSTYESGAIPKKKPLESSKGPASISKETCKASDSRVKRKRKYKRKVKQPQVRGSPSKQVSPILGPLHIDIPKNGNRPSSLLTIAHPYYDPNRPMLGHPQLLPRFPYYNPLMFPPPYDQSRYLLNLGTIPYSSTAPAVGSLPLVNYGSYNMGLTTPVHWRPSLQQSIYYNPQEVSRYSSNSLQSARSSPRNYRTMESDKCNPTLPKK